MKKKEKICIDLSSRMLYSSLSNILPTVDLIKYDIAVKSQKWQLSLKNLVSLPPSIFRMYPFCLLFQPFKSMSEAFQQKFDWMLNAKSGSGIGPLSLPIVIRVRLSQQRHATFKP